MYVLASDVARRSNLRDLILDNDCLYAYSTRPLSSAINVIVTDDIISPMPFGQLYLTSQLLQLYSLYLPIKRGETSNYLRTWQQHFLTTRRLFIPLINMIFIINTKTTNNQAYFRVPTPNTYAIFIHPYARPFIPVARDEDY